MDHATYDRLVAGLYRAATGEIEWNQALEDIRAGFGARNSQVQTLASNSGRLTAVHMGGPEYAWPTLEYLREYHRHDAAAESLRARPADTWQHCGDETNPDHAAMGRYFRDYLVGFDAKYVSRVMIGHGPTTNSVFEIQRSASQGSLTPGERHHAERIAEHLRKALTAYERIRPLLSQALAGHKLLAAFPHPMWLLDADRRVSFNNRAAERETEEAVRVAVAGSRLRLLDNAADEQLGQRLAALAAAAHGTGTSISLRCRQSDPPVWLHLSALVPEQAMGAFGEQRNILATLFDPGRVSALDPFAIASIFRLTPAEAKVATQIAEGLTPAQIAAASGTRITTVRYHLSHLFAKLGVPRQADIVRVLRQGEALWASAATAPRQAKEHT